MATRMRSMVSRTKSRKLEKDDHSPDEEHARKEMIKLIVSYKLLSS